MELGVSVWPVLSRCSFVVVWCKRAASVERHYKISAHGFTPAGSDGVGSEAAAAVVDLPTTRIALRAFGTYLFSRLEFAQGVIKTGCTT